MDVIRKKREVEGKTMLSIVDWNSLKKSYRRENGQMYFLLFIDILIKTDVLLLLLVSFDQL
jgi:hypothetical protein